VVPRTITSGLPKFACPAVDSSIIPNFAVEFKESNKIMMQNTEKSLVKRKKFLSKKKHKKMTKIIRQDEQD